MFEDEYGGPWIPKAVPKNPGDLLTMADIAKAITLPGQEIEKVASKVRWYARQGYLHPIAKETAGRKSYLYLPDQCLTAEILIRMGEFGINVAKGETSHAAWRAITVWRSEDFPGSHPPAISPGMHVIKEYEAGVRDWTFELWSFAHRESGRLRFDARIAANQRGEGSNFSVRREDGFEARAVFAVDLIDVLDRIHPRNRPQVH